MVSPERPVQEEFLPLNHCRKRRYKPQTLSIATAQRYRIDSARDTLATQADATFRLKTIEIVVPRPPHGQQRDLLQGAILEKSQAFA